MCPSKAKMNIFVCEVCDYQCSTARGMRVHHSRGWCQVEEEEEKADTTRTSTSSTTLGKRRYVAEDGGSEGVGNAVLDGDDEECFTETAAVVSSPPSSSNLVVMFTPSPRAGVEGGQPLPLPERIRGVSAAAYATQVKYLVLSKAILDKVNGEDLDQVARNELFLMKFCLDNGLGRDQGQQLLNWMKLVRNITIYPDICAYLDQYLVFDYLVQYMLILMYLFHMEY